MAAMDTNDEPTLDQDAVPAPDRGTADQDDSAQPSPEADAVGDTPNDESDASEESGEAEPDQPFGGFGSLFSHQATHQPTPLAPTPPASAESASPFGLLFQAPELTELPERPARRRSRADDDDAETDAAPASRSSSRRRRPEAQVADRTEDQEDSRVDGQDDDAEREDSGAQAVESAGEGDSDQPEPGGSAQDGQDSARDDEDDADGRGRRRRRRGGKGRRGRAQDQDEDQTDEARGDTDEREEPRSKGRRGSAAKKSAGDDADGGSAQQDRSGDTGQDDDGEQGDGSSKRRRRRRRDESPARASRTEVSGVKGSTRLEAKRQRRREGREAGRRRTIISEAEFLARRESVERTMLVRGLEDRTQIGVLEDGVLVEHYVSRASQTTTVGNVYLGRVQNVLPSMEAAFVDIGKGRNAVLYAGEVNWDAAGLDNAPKRIENALKSGEAVLVQVTKDPIGHKGARLTSQVSLPGRYLVYVPNGSMTGISRKLPDTERTRLKKILKEVVPADAGVIVRTAAEGATEAELRADVERLTKIWERIQTKAKSANAPAVLHSEAEMTTRVIRDIFNEDFNSLIVSGEDAWDEVSSYVASVAPDLQDRVQRWEPEPGGDRDIFGHYRAHEALAKALDRKVWLPSGGSLVIDRTEAMIVVDVNTGKFVGSGGDLEETVTKNNLEAAEEIVRQLRLRDIGGIIVIDFIDMVLESNRELVVRRLLECLGRDRTKHQVAEVTSLGLVQMTRKRVGSGLVEVFSETCSHCNGRGIIVHPEPVERSAAPVDSGQSRARGRGRGKGEGSNQQSGSGGHGSNGNGSNGNGSGSGSSGSGSNGNGSRSGRQGTNSLPAPNPNGPTPAQIAAAAHAAAVQAVANGVEKGSETEADTDQDAGAVTAVVSGETVTETASGQDAPAASATSSPTEPVTRPRRRRGRVVAPAGPPSAVPAQSVSGASD